MDLSQVKTALGAYFRVNNREVVAMVYKMAALFKYMRTITKVKGTYPATHSVTEHVVQQFQAVWTPIGQTVFRTNELKAYHQKVNFKITPAEVLNSWIAELYEEGKTPDQMSIAKYIMDKELMPKVVEDIEILLCDGVYDGAQPTVFGFSMNGLAEILRLGRLDTTNPMYKIGLPTITDANIVDVVTSFERRIPKKVRKFIKQIFMSTENAERYALAYEDKYGANTLIKEGDNYKTRLGKRVIVGIDDLGTNDIFATPDGNWVKLIDTIDEPKVTDIQILDYDVKIFMEWWLGMGFYINQLVLVNTTAGSGSALSADTQLYYSGE